MTLAFILGHLSILFVNTILGLNIPLTKMLMSEWVTPAGFMTIRSAGALILFMIAQCFIAREKVAPRDLIKIGAGGVIGFGVAQYTGALSLQFTTPVYFSMVVFMAPVITMILAAILLGETITLRKFCGVFLSIAGASILIINVPHDSAGNNHLLGIAFAFISTFAFSLYLISMRSVATKIGRASCRERV